VVFSTLGIEKARTYLDEPLLKKLPEETQLEVDSGDDCGDKMRRELQILMWGNVGIVRRVEDLNYVLSRLQEMGERVERIHGERLHNGIVELRNMVTVAKLIAKAAYIRRESRGTHYLVEYPTQDDGNWLRHIVFEDDQVEII
jgi:succinate dehydrogenase/fumarate reductase flavoprotein subunit